MARTITAPAGQWPYRRLARVKTITFNVNGIAFRVTYSGRHRYVVTGPLGYRRGYGPNPGRHRDVLLCHLGAAGHDRRIDSKTANWPEEAIVGTVERPR